MRSAPRTRCRFRRAFVTGAAAAALIVGGVTGAAAAPSGPSDPPPGDEAPRFGGMWGEIVKEKKNRTPQEQSDRGERWQRFCQAWAERTGADDEAEDETARQRMERMDYLCGDAKSEGAHEESERPVGTQPPPD